jgi:hypothetical protein
MPGAQAQAPRWSVADIDLGTRLDGRVELGDVALPEAAFARGDVLTTDGEIIAGAEVKVFEIATDAEPCNSVYRPEGDCYPPARLRHVTLSDEAGRAAIVLPDP